VGAFHHPHDDQRSRVDRLHLAVGLSGRSVDLSYELDVWGRVRRSIEAQRALAVAAADDEAVIRLTVQADVAQFYYAVRGFDAQLAILEETVASYREQVRILTIQFNTGLARSIPMSQAQPLLIAYGDVEDALTDLHALGRNFVTGWSTT
jgi:outer membrane protein TolC